MQLFRFVFVRAVETSLPFEVGGWRHVLCRSVEGQDVWGMEETKISREVVSRSGYIPSRLRPLSSGLPLVALFPCYCYYSFNPGCKDVET